MFYIKAYNYIYIMNDIDTNKHLKNLFNNNRDTRNNRQNKENEINNEEYTKGHENIEKTITLNNKNCNKEHKFSNSKKEVKSKNNCEISNNDSSVYQVLLNLSTSNEKIVIVRNLILVYISFCNLIYLIITMQKLKNLFGKNGVFPILSFSKEINNLDFLELNFLQYPSIIVFLPLRIKIIIKFILESIGFSFLNNENLEFFVLYLLLQLVLLLAHVIF